MMFLTVVQPKITEIESYLIGFLEKDATAFCKELWDLCRSAQENAQGIPPELLKAKTLEVEKERVSGLQHNAHRNLPNTVTGATGTCFGQGA